MEKEKEISRVRLLTHGSSEIFTAYPATPMIYTLYPKTDPEDLKKDAHQSYGRAAPSSSPAGQDDR